MQVINKHFKDLSFVRANGDDLCSQHLVVYTESKDDRGMLMVR